MGSIRIINIMEPENRPVSISVSIVCFFRITLAKERRVITPTIENVRNLNALSGDAVSNDE